MPLTMFCWGSTIHGELGLGGVDQDHVATPQKLDFGRASDVIQVSCGDSHTVMLTKNGEIFSCGNNDSGQLGHGRRRGKLGKNLERRPGKLGQNDEKDDGRRSIKLDKSY